jgi:hypothetical protein
MVDQQEDMLFASNLYPHEITDSLLNVMRDNKLIENTEQDNCKLIQTIANRQKVKTKVINCYRILAKEL